MNSTKVFKRGNCSNFDSYENCIIVGNASRILSSGCGDFVDSFDLVVRLNNAPTSNFEIDVGSKTDLRVINRVIQGGTTVKGSNLNQNYLERIDNDDVLLYPSNEKVEERVEGKINDDVNLFILSEDFKNYIGVLEDFIGINKISTGLFSIVLFIHIFGGITIINFDFYDTTSSGSSHYWENFDGGDLSRHSFEKEKEFFNQELRDRVVNFVKL